MNIVEVIDSVSKVIAQATVAVLLDQTAPLMKLIMTKAHHYVLSTSNVKE